MSSTLFFSPDYTGEIGDNWVYETSIEKPIMHGLSISGTLGNQWGDESDGGMDYTYWNAGVSKEFREMFTVDVRYWDTDIGSSCDTADSLPMRCPRRGNLFSFLLTETDGLFPIPCIARRGGA